MAQQRVAVIGAGAFGTAMANVFADAGHGVVLWSRSPDVVEAIRSRRENPKYLPGYPLNERVGATGDLTEAVEKAQWVVCGIPTQQIRGVFSPLRQVLKHKPVVSISKGIELDTHKCVSEIFAEILPASPYLVISGPSFAVEVLKRLPTAVTLASARAEVVREVQSMLSTPYFRAYRSEDVVGVEIAGALKNVIAVASGMVAGLNLGFNSQAALITRGLAEITRLAVARGADPRSFLGLSGMGDLMMTCTAPLSRNRTLGVLLAEGCGLEEAREKLGGVAEGFYTAKAAHRLAGSMGVEMPITEQVYAILYEGHTPKQALEQLMTRDLKHEWE